MSKIFKAVERAWESRGAAPLVTVGDERGASRPAVAPAVATPRDGAGLAPAPSRDPPPPSIGLVADYDLVEAVADGVILVVHPDHTNRALGLKALNSIHPDRLIGVVLNCSPDWFLSRPFGHGYYHHYSDRP